MRVINLNTLAPFLLATATSAFVLQPSSRPYGIQSHTKLYNSRVDTTKAVQAALDASQKHGASSKEARILWDIVEEMDASDNSAAYTGGISEDECLLNGSDNPECQKYYNKLGQLHNVLEDNKFRMDQVKNLVAELQNIKLVDPSAASSGPSAMDGAGMQTAIKEAQEATSKYGIDSSEAKLAWESVEEIGASNNSEAYKPDLEDECLIETLQACQAIEELSRAVSLLQSDSRYQG